MSSWRITLSWILYIFSGQTGSLSSTGMEALQTGSPSRWPAWTSQQPVPTEAPNRVSQSSSFLLPEPKSLQCPLGTITIYTETATSPFSGVTGDFALIPESLNDHGHAYAKSSKQTARPLCLPWAGLTSFFSGFFNSESGSDGCLPRPPGYCKMASLFSLGWARNEKTMIPLNNLWFFSILVMNLKFDSCFCFLRCTCVCVHMHTHVTVTSKKLGHDPSMFAKCWSHSLLTRCP